jgi:hypothetical protein
VSRDPIADARHAGLSVERADLGDWSPALLISEYEPQRRAIVVNERALERMRSAAGTRGADALFAAAVAHELYHRAVAEGELPAPASHAAAERRAAAFVRERYGIAPQGFELELRR